MTHAIAMPSTDPQRRYRLTLLVLATLMALLAPTLRADDVAKAKADRALDNEPAQWMRFTEDNKGNGKLEVGIGTYQNEAGVTVHLVGAVHVGDKKYYDDLDKLFESYDALLYEMVKPQGTDAPVRGQKGSGSMVSMFQRFLTDVLELNYQLDGIDYNKKNFVHADLDAETFEKLQAERGESIIGLMFQQMVRDLAKSAEGKEAAKNQPGLLELIDAFNSPDRGKKLKLVLGRSFGDMEAQISGFQGTVLVTERNKKALAVLKDAIRSGRKNVGVFYGAAHMPDMETRLALMGFKRTAMEYKTAWDISDPKPLAPKKEKAADEIKKNAAN